MFYIISIAEREKPKFDAYIDGVLFDKEGELAINYFSTGVSVKEKANAPYKVKADAKYSEIGMVRDRLVTKVHNTPILIVSEKFKRFLSKNYKDLAEFFPVEFDKVNKKPLFGYFICNLIRKYDCVDYENSILDFNFYNDDNEGYDGIYTIDSLVIDKSKIPKKAHIFLLDNIDSPVIIVSQEMKQEMESQNITGFKFIKPEEFMI